MSENEEIVYVYKNKVYLQYYKQVSVCLHVLHTKQKERNRRSLKSLA